MLEITHIAFAAHLLSPTNLGAKRRWRPRLTQTIKGIRKLVSYTRYEVYYWHLPCFRWDRGHPKQSGTVIMQIFLYYTPTQYCTSQEGQTDLIRTVTSRSHQLLGRVCGELIRRHQEHEMSGCCRYLDILLF
jgi:hypothetical protein